MRNILLILILSFVHPKAFAATPSLNELRALYNLAATSKDACCKLIKKCNEQSLNTDEMVLGYKACATMIMAKYYFNPINKLNSFNNGKLMLEMAIKKNEANAELRYLRLTIQINSPVFLSYYKNIKEDKQFLTKCLSSIKDEELKSLITIYLKSI